MHDVAVIDDPAAAASALEPTRARILGLLEQPGSATTIAAALGESRQKVNYHLRTLERHGLVELVEERRRRGLTERILVASAGSYVVSPDVFGRRGASPERIDRLSSHYLIALAARLVREVGALARGADRDGRPLATLAIDTEIRFASAASRAAFTEELSTVVQQLAARYHDETAPRGRPHRLVVAAHPVPPPAAPSPSPSPAPAAAPDTSPTEQEAT